MAKDDGSEMVTWTGHGTGHQLEQRRRDVGSIFCCTSSTTGNKLAFLNNIVGVFEYDADKMGNSEKYGSGNRTLTSYNSILYHSLFFYYLVASISYKLLFACCKLYQIVISRRSSCKMYELEESD